MKKKLIDKIKNQFDHMIELNQFYCSHTNKEGKIKGNVAYSTHLLCDVCNKEFDMKSVDDDDLKSAIDTILNVLEQSKVFANDKFATHMIGYIEQAILQIPELYKYVKKCKGKKK